MSGITTIKSFTAEDYEVSRLALESEAYRRSNAKAIRLSTAYIPLIMMLILVGFTALLFFGSFAAINGKITVVKYRVLVFLIQRLLSPLTRLGDTFDQYQRAMPSTNRVINLLDTPITIEPGSVPLCCQQVRGEVKFQDVNLVYPGRPPLIKNLSLVITAGKTIAIVGSTGFSKSTLVKLLLQFYELQAGKIILNGFDIPKLRL